MTRWRCYKPRGFSMKMKWMLAASLMVFACACQDQRTQQNQNMQQDQMNRPKPAGGCGSCETQKPQTLPKEEAKPTASVPSVAQQTTEASAPAAKTEAKLP